MNREQMIEYPKGAPTVDEFRARVLVILAQAMHEPLSTGYACRRITEEYAKAAEAEQDRLADALVNTKATMGERIADREKIARDIMAERDRLARQVEAVEVLADQWDDMLRTMSAVMTTAQRNAWRWALHQLRTALATEGPEQ